MTEPTFHVDPLAKQHFLPSIMRRCFDLTHDEARAHIEQGEVYVLRGGYEHRASDDYLKLNEGDELVLDSAVPRSARIFHASI